LWWIQTSFSALGCSIEAFGKKIMRFSILILIACLLVSCLPPTTGQPPMGDRYLGTFEAVAEDYREVVRIYESDGLRFEHKFYRNGVLVIKESGKVEVDGYSVFFRDAFTEFIDSESARPLPQPVIRVRLRPGSLIPRGIGVVVCPA
jgi:hypothetical protein